MEPQQGKYVRDLKAWELLRLEDCELELLDEFAAKARVMYFDRALFAEELYEVFLDRLRDLMEKGVNETIEYWLKGLADGNDGQFPEFCLEFPYLQRNENVDALTLAYCVDNEDGTRTELNRMSLRTALQQLVDNECATEDLQLRAKVVVQELRDLADIIETSLVRARLLLGLERGPAAAQSS